MSAGSWPAWASRFAAWSLVITLAYKIELSPTNKDSRLQKIQGRKQEDTDQIDEVPEQPGVLHPVGEPRRVGLPQLRARTQEIGVHRHPAHHVQHVQPGQREVDGQEVVGAGKQVVVELVAVFEILDDEEHAPEQDR